MTATDAFFSLLRCVPDPARAEPINVGVLVWGTGQQHFIMPPEAVSSAVARAPRLSRKSFQAVEEIVRDELGSGAEPAIALDRGLGLFFHFTPAAQMWLNPNTDLRVEAQELANTLVKPLQRSGFGFKLPADISRTVNLMVRSRVVHRRFPVRGRQVVRTVDYAAVNGHVAGLDVFQNSTKVDEDFQRRVDAQAFKAEDLLRAVDTAGDDVRRLERFAVWWWLRGGYPPDARTESGIRIFRDAGLIVLHQPQEMVQYLQAEAGVGPALHQPDERLRLVR